MLISNMSVGECCGEGGEGDQLDPPLLKAILSVLGLSELWKEEV